MDKKEVIKNRKRICPTCKQEYEVQSFSQALGNMFRRPTWNEWFILIMLVMVIIGGFQYYKETKLCRSVLARLDDVCSAYFYEKSFGGQGTKENFNPANFSLDFVKRHADNISAGMLEMENKINNMEIYPNDSPNYTP